MYVHIRGGATPQSNNAHQTTKKYIYIYHMYMYVHMCMCIHPLISGPQPKQNSVQLRKKSYKKLQKVTKSYKKLQKKIKKT